MATDSAELLDWIETGLWRLPEAPGVTCNVSIPGIRGSAAPQVPHPFVNLVGDARWSADDADARIAEVRRYFEERGLPLLWVVGPSGTPDDLLQRLQRLGFQKAIDIAGMVRSDLHLDVPINPEVHIRKLTDTEEILNCGELFGAAYGMPTDAAEVFLRQMVEALPDKTLP